MAARQLVYTAPVTGYKAVAVNITAALRGEAWGQVE